ncbi:twin-arginine translocation signal domain-containing protein [Natronomonas salina]|uniref:twin-arginine translocation signal domain-containing protein n=1 Tax=Natronomonas salina TaxID=1710540 RepID=UPI0015B3C8B3|nr:twin-arginine translocation signal domain-containing protein [Natronomonas salina]QLD88379.1 twin-arginine translocation signal domain-containing protein [Natronomonas salina]
MERRDVLKTAGGIGAGTAVGGLGVIALTGNATAANANLDGISPSAVTTDDGEITYVSYGGRLRFEWDGLDSDATYGEYQVYTRHQRGDNSWTSWADQGSRYGQLGDGSGGEYEEGETGGWGGDNDSNSGSGTDGFFQFKFGSPYSQKDYAIAYDDSSDLDTDGDGTNDAHPVSSPYSTDPFTADEDGGTNRTKVDVRKVCRVYDGEPGSGTQLIEAEDTARFEVTVNNREATATTGGEVNGNVEADQS